jgi:hypothetical protein
VPLHCVMARIILHWLNEEVKLSHEITSLTEDFRNGYLLGELLHKYNQQHHFNKFVDRETPDAKIKNFCLLEPTMRQIGVFFNSQIAFDIINAKPGATKTLLYEIRTVLEAAKSMSKSADSHQMKRVMQIIKPSIPNYDKTMSATFENAMRSMVENPNDILMERATHKFSKMTETFHESVSNSYSHQMSDIRYELQRTKEIEREKYKHEKEFQQTWDQINQEQWKKNQLKARSRRNLSQKVSGEQIRRETARRVLENTSARDKAISSIDDFEDRIADLKKRDQADNTLLALKTVGSMDDGSGIPSLAYLDEGTLKAGMIQNQKEMQDRNEKMLLRQSERDRRRKRFVRLKESDQAAHLQMEAEGEIFTRVLTISELEEVESLAKMRIMVYKDLFVQNVQTRTALMKSRKEEYQEYLNRCIEYDKDIEMSWVITNRVLAQVARLDALEEAQCAAYNQESLETVQREVARILDITDWIVNVRAIGDYSGGIDMTSDDETTLLPKAILSDVHCMYTNEHLAVPLAFPVPQKVNVYADFPLSLSWKPQCPEVDWLLNKPFRGCDFMTDVAAAPIPVPREEFIDGEAKTVEDEAVKLVPSPPSPEVISPSLMSNYLTCNDSKAFITSIATFEPPLEDPGAPGEKAKTSKAPPAKKEAAKKGKNDVEEVESGLKIVPPAWIANTPASSVLGEVIVASRCVADPIPEHPTAPTDIPQFPLRVILCGASHAVKRTVASALEAEFKITVLRVDDLVSTAISVGEELALNADDLPSTPLQSLSLHIFSKCQRGLAVDDDSYVGLLVEAIKALDVESVGFVIEDFPNTRDQAAKLVVAISGVDYDASRPQSSDKVSEFLTSVPRATELFDASKCGLDRAFFINIPPAAIAKNRICLRKDLRSGEIVSMTDETKSVETLAELVTPRNAMDTISLFVATTTQAINPMEEFMKSLGIASAFGSDDGTDTPVIEGILSNIRDLVSSRLPVEELTTSSPDIAQEAAALDGEVAASPPTDASGTPPSESTPPLILQEGQLPPRLAKILADIWKAGEEQTVASSRQFFAVMRELHYQMIQRRGAIRQVTVTQMLLRDNKQDIFDKFRDDFNSFEEDFRFDAELINELFLRTLELRDTFWEISENKAKQAKAVIQKVSLDGMANVFIHNAQCEGAAMLQSYLGLFVAGLNVLFDYMRATSAYNFTGAYGQVLEPVAPVTNPTLTTEDAAAGGAKGAKKDDKKGSKSGDGRSPIAPPVLWSEMETLPPSTAAEEEVVDDKAKKKDPKKVR